MRSPEVSICLPVYNGEEFLAETLRSLQAQDFDDFEILACDNASTDGTREILQEHASRDARIRILYSESNRGAAWNYNRGVEEARGRYFKWAACDDLLSPDYLRVCLDLFEERGADLVLAYAPTTLIDRAGSKIEDYPDRIQLRHERPQDRLRALLENLRLCNAVFGLHRTRILRASARIGPYVSSDVVLLAELSLHGQIDCCERGRFYRRMHRGSAYGGERPLEEIALWFDTTPSEGPFLPRSRLLMEFLKSIGRAPIRERDRISSVAELLRSWLPHNWRAMAGEWKREILIGRRAKP